MPFFGLLSSMRCSGGTAENTRPLSISPGMYLKNRVARRQRMWAPSESASAMKMIRP
jgi:hypothetical protein